MPKPYQQANGRWAAAIELPPGLDGKRRRKVVTARTESECKKKARAVEKEFIVNGDLNTNSPTLKQWSDTWLEQRRKNVAPSTWVGYELAFRKNINPAIGRYRLDKLTPAHIARMHAYITQERGLSSTTALLSHRILVKCLTDARRQRLVNENVATLIDAPRKALNTRKSLSAEEAKTILIAANEFDMDITARVAVALLCGLRRGEIIGITVDAIDFEKGILSVAWQTQQLKYSHGCGKKDTKKGWPCGKPRAGSCPLRTQIVPVDYEVRDINGGLNLVRPKSRAGWRQVPMIPAVQEMLRRLIDTRGLGPEGLIFHTNGRAITPEQMNDDWKAVLLAAGVEHVPLHSARHTCATLLFRLNIPDQIRIAILGHSSATVTAGYTHVSNAETAAAMERLGGLLAIEG